MAEQVITHSLKEESKSPPGRLYFQVVPEAQRLKQLLYDGFVRNATPSIIPPEIINICAKYYDEVTHWKIPREELEPYFNNNQQLYTQIFCIDDVKMQCSFLPNKTEEDTVFYLHIYQPKGVERIMIYSELFCKENDAHFRYVVPYSDETMPYNTIIESEKRHHYEYVMYLKCKDFDCINLSYYVEVLSINYDDGTASYFKPIRMKKKLSFKWSFDEAMVKKFRNAGIKQMFLSETFDEYNNNWGLWLIPMDYDKYTDKKRVQVALTLYKKPAEIYEISVKYKLETDYKNIKNEGAVRFLENNTFEYLEPLFESEVLNELDQFSMTMHIEISSVNFHDNFAVTFSNVFE